jgi:hypothetical protein
MTLSVDAATDVLAQVHEELGDFDPDTRALVALTQTGGSSLEMTDVRLTDNGVLEVDDEIAGLVLVTGDRVDLAEQPDPVAVRHVVVVLRDGVEVGMFRLGEEDATLHRWSNLPGGEEDATVMRPRERAANLARRAFGLPSVVDDVPVTELVARIWAVHVAQVALRVFDEHGGKPVPLDTVTAEVLATEPDLDVAQLSWGGARQLAIRDRLRFGPYRFDPDQAAWLDASGFAQHVLEAVPAPEEFLDTLAAVTEGDIEGWALAELERRGWRAPAPPATAERARTRAPIATVSSSGTVSSAAPDTGLGCSRSGARDAGLAGVTPEP